MWAYVGTYEFWNRGTIALFDIHIVNLDTGSYISMTPEKLLANAEQENK